MEEEEVSFTKIFWADTACIEICLCAGRHALQLEKAFEEFLKAILLATYVAYVKRQ